VQCPMQWRRADYYRSWFVRSCGCTFLITGLGKVLAATGNSTLLKVLDPLIGIPFRELMLAVGLGEIGISTVCLAGPASFVNIVLIAWFAALFATYRLGLSVIGWHHPCVCMGSAAEVLHLSDETADGVMKVVLIYLLSGSLYFLVSRLQITRLCGGKQAAG
jgi:hypothetical protein